jgi:ABC-type phosphate transport system ATPase subunit
VGDESVEVCIIPGLELRLNIFNSHEESINFHVLFDPEICSTDFIKDNFLEKLKVNYRGSDYDLKERTLVAIGFSIIENQPLKIYDDYSTLDEITKAKYLKAAYSTVTLSQVDISSASKAITEAMAYNGISKKPFLKIIAGKGHGSLKKLKWFEDNHQFSRVGLTRESLTNVTDIVFSNDADDIAFYLGLHPKTNLEEVKQRFGSSKPCVWGSDCHSIGSLLHPSNGNSTDYTWIKADPCFEGLRQVVFEPGDRVQIQENIPQSKLDYLIIDEVSFIGEQEAKYFSLEPIPLNLNLNAIIGGKSSGKSLLLYHIAKAIDPQQVKEKMALVGVKAYAFENQVPSFDFIVKWKDGFTNSFKEPDNKKNRRITYIPQMYINHLAEEKGEQKLKELIEDILQQNIDLKAFWDLQKDKIKQAKLTISGIINETYSLRETVRETQLKIREVGDKTGITNSINKIKGDIDQLRLQTGFSEIENREYEKLTRSKDFGQKKIARYEGYNNTIGVYENILDQTQEYVVNELNTYLENYVQFNEDLVATKFAQHAIQDDVDALKSCFQNISKKYADLKQKTSGKTKVEETKVTVTDSSLAPYLTKIVNQALLKQLNDQLNAEQIKIKQIEDLEKINSEYVANGKALKIKLIETYSQLFELYKETLRYLKQEQFSSIGKGIDLEVELTYDTYLFGSGFCNLLDGRTNFKSNLGSCFDDSNTYNYNEEGHLQNVKDLFDKVWNPEKNNIKLRTGVEVKDLSGKLFEDYFTFKYKIRYKSEDILEMSPGKRGLVLLQLILHLSNASHPILIDQPEDNLDNRTIYNELNQFIREKKLLRQIIIVTHNANLVVSTDAEEIIIANQDGQEKGKENKEFAFEYISGSLENSFKNFNNKGILYQTGIREHVCDILEGGEDAFKKREEKYCF